MEKFQKILAFFLGMVMLMTMAGCNQKNDAAATEAVVKPADNPVLGGSVAWCRGSAEYDEMIGYSGEWSLQVGDAAQWEELSGQYGLVMDAEEEIDFSKYVILVLFYAEHTGSVYELTELAMVDGMATIGIHEKTPGETAQEELVGCIVQLEEAPLEINSYRDEETVG